MEKLKSRNLFIISFLILLFLNICDTVITNYGINQYGIDLELNFLVKAVMKFTESPLLSMCMTKSIILILPVIFIASNTDREKILINASIIFSNFYYITFMCIFHVPYLILN